MDKNVWLTYLGKVYKPQDLEAGRVQTKLIGLLEGVVSCLDTDSREVFYQDIDSEISSIDTLLFMNVDLVTLAVVELDRLNSAIDLEDVETWERESDAALRAVLKSVR